MAGNPLENLFYHKQIHRYSYVVTSLFSELKVNTEGKVIRIPIEYNGGTMYQDSHDYRAAVIPIGTIKYIGFQVNTEKVENRNQRKNWNGNLQLNRVPVTLTYELTIRVKQHDEMFQIMEQLTFLMYPQLDIRIVGNEESDIKEALKLILDSYEYTDENDGLGNGKPIDITYMLQLQGGHFYGRVLNGDNQFVIKEVDIQMGVMQTSGEITYGAPMMNVLGTDELQPRFDALKPLEPNQGVYLYDSTTEPETLEVIGSGNYIKPGL